MLGHLAVNPLIMANNNINTTPGPNQNLNQNQGALESPRCNPHPHVITPRMPERRSSLPSHPSAYQSRQFQSEHHQPHQQQGSNNLSTYEQNLQLQEMRLAQHPQRQSLRYNNDQKYMELQLLKERELNEELDRGIGSSSSENSNNYSTVVPY